MFNKSNLHAWWNLINQTEIHLLLKKDQIH